MNAPHARVARRPVHGVLLLDKPLGWSSNQALQKVKWLLRAVKAGHTGTLDPLATGVLPLCFGAATKFSQIHLEANKAYEATLLLGIKTNTADAEGDVIERRPVHITPFDVEKVVSLFTGSITQVPPMFSALKKDGKSLYTYAREGIEIERASRAVTIFSLKIAEMELTGAAPSIRIEVSCSKGTYIRTLGEDIGEALGCGAHLGALRRVQTGNFRQEHCIGLDTLEAMNEEQRLNALAPIDSLLDGFLPITLDNENTGRFLSGVRRRGDWPDTEQIVVYAAQPRALLGTAHAKAGELIPSRLLNPDEVREVAVQYPISEKDLVS